MYFELQKEHLEKLIKNKRKAKVGSAMVQELTFALLGCSTDTTSNIVKAYSDAVRANDIGALNAKIREFLFRLTITQRSDDKEEECEDT